MHRTVKDIVPTSSAIKDEDYQANKKTSEQQQIVQRRVGITLYLCSKKSATILEIYSSLHTLDALCIHRQYPL